MHLRADRPTGRFRVFRAAALLTGLMLLAAGPPPTGHALAEPVDADPEAETAPELDGEALFGMKVLPLLKARCFACHGEKPDKIKGELDMTHRRGLLSGGESGDPALVPGEPEASLMLEAVWWRNDDLQMPPKENDRLNDQQIATLRRWIEAGAPWPEVTPAKRKQWAKQAPGDGVHIPTSGGRSPEWTYRRYDPEEIWAFFPIDEPAVPDVKGTDHPIDAFIRRRLNRKDIDPAPRADRRTLIRRATYDLTGLPPTPRQVQRFLSDNSPDAFRKLIDRLLAKKAYGEQWARHWLDVTRYADTAGFANDYERPYAWRYRDYVIRSFNADKPYDQFVREQIAGDEIAPDDPEALIATGFLRMGPWEHTGMSVKKVTRQQWLNDVTNIVGRTFLAQGMRCARCHDHKFDPIPTKDFYRMQAVFAPAQFADRKVPFLDAEHTAGFKQRQQREKEKLNTKALHADEKSEGLRRARRKRQAYLKRAVQRFEPRAMSVYNGPLNVRRSAKLLENVPPPKKRKGPVQEVRILEGGSLKRPQEKVRPGVLSGMRVPDDAPKGFGEIPDTMNGRRRALADWIASPHNTLTARVIVNRVWQHHFAGQGLVATPNNFGHTGARPTHPELLDWLATWFIDHGWSLKKLHRLIMTSSVYQRSGTHPAPDRLAKADPDNTLLASYPPRRLAAEEIRDSMLAATVELNRRMGGPGVFPLMNWQAALQPRHIMGSVAPAYQPSPDPRQRHRRTIYAFRTRGLKHPMLTVFNRPGPDNSCARRDETTVTPQAFSLFNGRFAHDRALALAERLEAYSHDRTEQVRRAFRLLYGRAPTESQLRMCLDHVRRMAGHHRGYQPVPSEPPTRVTRKAFEETTGEPFVFHEKLLDMQRYQPDTKPWDVGPQTRALAELCLVLLNSNEFLYVY